MEIRRAILLFAIVLGLAALVTSFTRSTDQEDGARDTDGAPQDERAAPPPAANGGSSSAGASPSAEPAQLRFPAGAEATARRLATGRAATLTVEVLAPGQVAIEDLGLNASAEPGVPARFDVLAGEPGRHPITFMPVNGADGRTIGVLRVRD